MRVSGCGLFDTEAENWYSNFLIVTLSNQLIAKFRCPFILK
jgi:hypothetical protein